MFGRYVLRALDATRYETARYDATRYDATRYETTRYKATSIIILCDFSAISFSVAKAKLARSKLITSQPIAHARTVRRINTRILCLHATQDEIILRYGIMLLCCGGGDETLYWELIL